MLPDEKPRTHPHRVRDWHDGLRPEEREWLEQKTAKLMQVRREAAGLGAEIHKLRRACISRMRRTEGAS